MRSRNAVPEESGFALILALLALLLLTFLALTLATTTRTELQISTNYRWSQSALFNAEAGLEVGRAVLSNMTDGQTVLPFARNYSWKPDTISNPAAGTPGAPFAHPRNFEKASCDYWGNGVGNGAILVDPSNPGAPFSNVNTMFGERLNGTFTLWVRRDLKTDGTGLRDEVTGEQLVLLAEGQAPFSTGAVDRFTTANVSVRHLELKVTLREGCKASGPQASQTGFSDCELLP